MSRIFDNLQLPALQPKNELHPLSYEWCFWQHMRFSNMPKDLEISTPSLSTTTHDDDEEDDNTTTTTTTTTNTTTNHNYEQQTSNNPIKSELRDAQYLKDTTILQFPKVYSNNLEFTDTIDSVEQFWVSLANMKNLNDVAIDTEYFFFKKGIKPLWEDEHNKIGGRWSFTLGNNHFNQVRKSSICIFWELLLLKLISGQFIDSKISIPLTEQILDNPEFDDVNVEKKLNNLELNKLIMDDIAGIVISIRNKKVILSIWNTHLSYEQYKKGNDVSGNIKNEEYSYLYKEKLNFKNREIFEKLGLTTYQFRQLIFMSCLETMNEAIEIVKDKENIRDVQKLFKQQIFKYIPHFNEGTIDLKKTKYPNTINKTRSSEWHGNKNKRYDSNVTNESEKFSNLGKIRKKVEFTEEGLMVEELNVLSLRQKWSRKRRPYGKSKEEGEDDENDEEGN